MNSHCFKAKKRFSLLKNLLSKYSLKQEYLDGEYDLVSPWGKISFQRIKLRNLLKWFTCLSGWSWVLRWHWVLFYFSTWVGLILWTRYRNFCELFSTQTLLLAWWKIKTETPVYQTKTAVCLTDSLQHIPHTRPFFDLPVRVNAGEERTKERWQIWELNSTPQFLPASL